MQKPFVLITGDDSIKGEGIILLKKIVEEFADYQVISTRTQQSVVGAGLKMKGGEWGYEEVDGHETIWVDGFPSDSVYFAFEYFKNKNLCKNKNLYGRKIDLVISGMNHGENIENGTLPRSGTVSQAHTAAVSRLTPAVAFSRRIHSRDWMKDHDGEFNQQLLEYPGKLIEKIIKLALNYKFPRGGFWNVNFPYNPTNIIKVVETHFDGCYPNKQTLHEKIFTYDFVTKYDGWPDGTDAGELNKGFATITPCKIEYTDFREIEKLKKLITENI